MPKPWYKIALSIAALFAFRMLGLFMLIPVFTVYAAKLNHASPDLIGLALGAYGLTQGLLQIPFGILSDKHGRKPILILGFALFALGSILGAISSSIYGVILARALQGAGAIGSVLIALLSDLVTEDKRTRSMAIIGSSIGISFSLAMIISPYLARHFGLAGIFILTALLALLGIIILQTIPKPSQQSAPQKIRLRAVFLHPQLMQLNAGIFIQHLLLTSTFFAIPLLLQQQINSGKLTHLWHFYLPVVMLGFLLMVPCIIISERKNKVKQAFITAVTVTLIGQLALLYQHHTFIWITLAMLIYFVAFNFLEANLPSLVSKHAPKSIRGTALGVYSSSQFLGIFVGGSVSGIVFNCASFNGIFILNACFALLWLLIATKTQTIAKAA